MNKKETSLLALLIIFTGILAYAQPKITSGDLPVSGDRVSLKKVDTTTYKGLGSAGASQSWDYSTLKLSTTNDSTETFYISPSNAPSGSSFSGANVVRKDTLSTGANFTYFKTSGNNMEMVGTLTRIGAISIVRPYSDGGIWYKTPITYNDKNSDTYSGTYTFVTITHYLKGNIDLVADAYGTLKLPGNTYNNVLRIHSVIVDVDSSNIPFVGAQVTKTTNDNYMYFQPGNKNPLMTDVTTTVVNSGGTTVNHQVSIIGSITTAINNPVVKMMKDEPFILYPNPAKDDAYITYFAKQNEAVRIDIMNIKGQLIKSMTEKAVSGVNNFSVNISKMNEGIYFIRTVSPSTTQTQKLIVE